MTDREIDRQRGARLRAAREEAGMTRAEVTAATGIPAGTLRAAEHGARVPTALALLAQLYGTTTAEDDGAVYQPMEAVPQDRKAPKGPGGRPRMPLPEDEGLPVGQVTDYASEYFARQAQEWERIEAEAAYLSALEQDPELAEREVKQKPAEVPVGFIIPDPPPPPPSPQAVAQARTETYARLMIPRGY
ncbi:helix-turn-helix domain-containing protein [Streptomyces sp. NPDC096033]|uniref:helix-turn-helix domain-containing protein n=1 Tax=Streptomyces sp. NPDC096033 TaxID=3366071 RepID=UPI003821D498